MATIEKELGNCKSRCCSCIRIPTLQKEKGYFNPARVIISVASSLPNNVYTGFYLLGGGGEDSPQTLQLPPKNFCQLSLTKSYNALPKNLSAISQLQGPQNCLRMLSEPLSEGSKFKNILGGGACPQTPLENCSLCLQPPSTITFNIFPPKPKILDRTLVYKQIKLHCLTTILI